MMKSYIKNRRRDTLRILAKEGDYILSIDNIKTVLKIEFAYSVNIDDISNDIEFLKQNELVTIVQHDPLLIVKLTTKGKEVVDGDRIVDGVARKTLELGL